MSSSSGTAERGKEPGVRRHESQERPRRWLLIAALACTFPALAKKRYRHSLGFRVDLPDGWNTEEAKSGATLLPPGVKVDPNREDNAEIYTLWSAEMDGSNEQDHVKSLRERFKASGMVVDRGGDIEAFSSPGRPGVIYTFDFLHPQRKLPYRIRVFAMQHKGKPLLLIAQGVREKVAARDGALRGIAKSLEW